MCTNNTVMVSLVSEQTLPNIMLIKAFEGEIDEYYFILTDEMSEYYKWIESWMKYFNESSTKEKQKKSTYFHIDIGSNEDNRDKVSEKLQENFEQKITSYKKIIVNITCGTKIMSIATYDYFYNNANSNSEIYYISDNEYKCLNDNKKTNTFRHDLINLNDYFKAYGIKINIDDIQSNNDIKRNIESIKEDLINCKDNTRGSIFEELMYTYVVDTFEECDNINDYVIRNAPIKKEHNSCVNNIIDIIGDDATLPTPDTDQEIDVVFVKNNVFYSIECKTTITTNKGEDEGLNSVIFKSNYVQHLFGSFAKTFIATRDTKNFYLKSNDNDRNKLLKQWAPIKKRLDIANIKLINLTMLEDKSMQEIIDSI